MKSKIANLLRDLDKLLKDVVKCSTKLKSNGYQQKLYRE